MWGTFTLWDPLDCANTVRSLNPILKGNRVIISVYDLESKKMKELGRFVIWEKTKKSSNSPEIEITFYDSLIYLMKSEDAFLFTKDKAHKKGWTAREITQFICRKYQIPIRRLPRARHRIPYFRVDSGSVYDVILKAWTEERANTKVRYVIRAEGDGLAVIAKRDLKHFWGVVEGENLIDSTFTDSLENMYTALTVTSEAGSNSSQTQTTTAGTQAPTDPTENFVGGAGGGEWKEGVASHFVVTGESALKCSGYALSDSLMGWGETSTNYAKPSSPWDWSALGDQPCGTILEVKYGGKVLRLPKVDIGRGGPGIGSVPRVMDLTTAAWDKFGIPRSKGIVKVQYRLLDGKATSTDTTSVSVNNKTAKTPAVRLSVQKRDKIKKYGYLHKLESMDAGATTKSAKLLATNKLNDLSRENYEAQVTTFLTPFIKAGDPVYIKDTGTGIKGRFYASDVSHQLSTGGCTTQISLNWLDLVPSLEIASTERQPPQSRTSGGNGSSGVGGGGAGGFQDGCGPVPGGKWSGGPGGGTHSFSSPPNNWESDNAWDIFAPDGTAVIAVGPGRIGRISPFRADSRFWGHGLYLNLNDGTELYYKHLKSVSVRSGQVVQAGEILGYLGTGVNGGPHLHFGARPPTDPGRFKGVCSTNGGPGGSGSNAAPNAQGELIARWRPFLGVNQYNVLSSFHPIGTHLRLVKGARGVIVRVVGRPSNTQSRATIVIDDKLATYWQVDGVREFNVFASVWTNLPAPLGPLKS
jgi:murein DD-endopeptidase MepM/ murein hydrolase activator NlpD